MANNVQGPPPYLFTNAGNIALLPEFEVLADGLTVTSPLGGVSFTTGIGQFYYYYATTGAPGITANQKIYYEVTAVAPGYQAGSSNQVVATLSTGLTVLPAQPNSWHQAAVDVWGMALVGTTLAGYNNAGVYNYPITLHPAV